MMKRKELCRQLILLHEVVAMTMTVVRVGHGLKILERAVVFQAEGSR
jgi:hypothetical protein